MMNYDKDIDSHTEKLKFAVNDSQEKFQEIYDELLERTGSKKGAYRGIRFSDIAIHSFPQMWGSTALGFEGMGGAAVCSAQTIVCLCRELNAANIYFNGRYAYTIKNINEKFVQALRNFNMPSVYDKSKLDD